MNVKKILNSLYNQGVRHVVCSPGGRCKDLLDAFLDDERFKVTTIYDERSASFYALGLSFRAPVCMLTTSGTATTELHSAVVEAYFQKDSQLILLTADRPQALRGTGAPQTIDQYELYKSHANTFIDLTDEEDLNSLDFHYPVHINVSLGDPNTATKKHKKSEFHWGPLILVSELNAENRQKVKKNLKDYEGCLILEPLSNLKQSDFPKALVLDYSESLIKKIGLLSFTRLIRIGGVPVSRIWRDQEELKDFSVAYVSDFSDFEGGSQVKKISLSEIPDKVLEFRPSEEVVHKILNYRESVSELIEESKDSEVRFLNNLAQRVPELDSVFVGNSLPIREWDFVKHKNLKILGQRGANGIDGSLAMALGRLEAERKGWIVLGDITALYNFNDFQILNKLDEATFNIVVVNNKGGQIFSRVFKENTTVYVNPHEHNFKSIAEFWGLDYFQLQKAEDLQELKTDPSHSLIELNPNSSDSEKFWKDLSEIEV